MITSYQKFCNIMQQHYQVKNLVGITPVEFRRRLEELIRWRDGAMEGFHDDDKQRDLSIRFHWGHDHDFGDFVLPGRMGDRHLSIPARFVDELGALPVDLAGKRILDIGVWTGGTSLLFCALGAEVVAIEEVEKYVVAVKFLKQSFDIQRLTVLNRSLYDLDDHEFYDRFDIVFFSGVLYHVTDPILALRIAFNALKDGGKCLVESAVIKERRSLVSYEGPTALGGGKKEELSRGGWNWFIPSPTALKQMMADVGFQQVKLKVLKRMRVLAVGQRISHCDMLRAGLSLRAVR